MNVGKARGGKSPRMPVSQFSDLGYIRLILAVGNEEENMCSSHIYHLCPRFELQAAFKGKTYIAQLEPDLHHSDSQNA